MLNILSRFYPMACLSVIGAVSLTLASSANSQKTQAGKSAKNNAVLPYSRLYDFKGVPLETTLAAFRKLPHPDGKNAKVVCTGDKDDSGGMLSLGDLATTSLENKLGVVKCAWWGKVYETLPEGIVGLSVPVEGYGVNVYSFDFIKDSKDGDLKLFKIFGQTHSDAYDGIVNALSKKFGPPETLHDTTQNGFGANFPNATNIWENPLSLVTVKQRWVEVNRMAIMITDNRLLAQFVETEENTANEVKNPI